MIFFGGGGVFSNGDLWFQFPRKSRFCKFKLLSEGLDSAYCLSDAENFSFLFVNCEDEFALSVIEPWISANISHRRNLVWWYLIISNRLTRVGAQKEADWWELYNASIGLWPCLENFFASRVYRDCFLHLPLVCLFIFIGRNQMIICCL